MNIEVIDLSFSYKNHLVLDKVSFTASEGELLTLLGPNGAGKSTLFQCVLGLLTGYTGKIKIAGEDAHNIGIEEMAKRIAYIPQSHAPAFNFTVFDVVLMGTASQVSAVKMPGKNQISLAESAIERLGISHLRNRGYTQISGGERQLVLIARALAQNTRILIMDEPTSSLDYGNQLRILAHIKTLSREGYTIILSTHNPDQAFMFADKVLALSGGRVIKCGTPSETISEELIKELYNVDVEVQSLQNDKIRVCLPKNLFSK